MYKDKIMALISILHVKEDQDSILLIEDMLKNCNAYVQKVNALEVFLTCSSAADPNEYRQRVAEMDKQRSVTHNSLISSVAIVNRLCTGANQQLIFEGNIDNRIEVANFAMKVMLELFENRRL